MSPEKMESPKLPGSTDPLSESITGALNRYISDSVEIHKEFKDKLVEEMEKRGWVSKSHRDYDVVFTHPDFKGARVMEKAQVMADDE